MKRSRSEIFAAILGELKDKGSVDRAKIHRSIGTDTKLFNSIIEAMKEQGMIDIGYEFRKSGLGRQREVLIATENLDHKELQILALSKVLSPSLSEIFSEWHFRKHPHSEGTLTKSQEEKIKSTEKFCNLFYRLVKETKNE